MGTPSADDGGPGLLRQLASILLLPGVVTIVVPGLLLAADDDRLVSWSRAPVAAVVAGASGVLLVVLGVVLVARTVLFFRAVGRGTLAPWDPTRKLVVAGVYRHVRNPMITGVLALLLGEAVLWGSLFVLGWFAVFALANALYLPLSEEPGLLRRFGEEYAEYRRNVPRWIPRRTPWEREADANGERGATT